LDDLSTDRPPISATTLEKLTRISTATLTTQLFKRGLRQAFLVDVKPLNPGGLRFAGEAFTMRHIPAREDLETISSLRGPDNKQWQAVEAIGPGQVMVIDSREDIRAASMGHMLVTRMLQRGAVAVVTDGAFRDGPDIARMDFPTFARGMTASTRLSFFHVADFQVPIGCAGVAVYPGDVVVGDAEGVVVIPRHLATEVADDGLEQEEMEAWLYTKVAAGLPLEGVYPPNEATVAEYQAWRKTQTNP
jgi:regulator of RNase E activity RraA